NTFITLGGPENTTVQLGFNSHQATPGNCFYGDPRRAFSFFQPSPSAGIAVPARCDGTVPASVPSGSDSPDHRRTATATWNPPRPHPHPRGVRPGQWHARPVRWRPYPGDGRPRSEPDRKSTRLNSSHVKISYAVFCLKKKTATTASTTRRGQYRITRTEHR